MLPALASPRCLLLAALAFPGLLAAFGCSTKEDKRPSSVPSASKSKETAQLGADRAATLRALGMPHRRLTQQLGAHALRCRSVLTTRVPSYPERKVEQELALRINRKGEFAAVKQTDPQHGQEAIWTGGWLYLRTRHNFFVRRKPRRDEASAIADRMYGYLPAYLGLLGRFIAFEKTGTTAGRIKLRLRLASSPEPLPAGLPPAKRWRRTITAKTLEGRAELCAKTGVPLKVQLKASWTFHPPARGGSATGVPKALDDRTVGKTTLVFSQEVAEVGQVAAIQPPDPAQTKTNLRRLRPEIERQILTGERPLPRAGGPFGDLDDE